jgi:hypothetical protein
MKSWIKIHTDIISDRKIYSLSMADRWVFVAVIVLAGEEDDRDANSKETGIIRDIANAAFKLRIDTDNFMESLSNLEKAGLIQVDGDLVIVSNYPKRQSRKPSDSRDEVRDRVRGYRARNGVSSDADRETDIQIREIERKRALHVTSEGVTGALHEAVTRCNALHDVVDVVDVVDPVALVFQRWEDLNPRKQVSPIDAQMLEDMIEDYTAEKVAEAIIKANGQGVTTLAYIEGILKNEANGVEKPKPKTKSRIVERAAGQRYA